MSETQANNSLTLYHANEVDNDIVPSDDHIEFTYQTLQAKQKPDTTFVLQTITDSEFASMKPHSGSPFGFDVAMTNVKQVTRMYNRVYFDSGILIKYPNWVDCNIESLIPGVKVWLSSNEAGPNRWVRLQVHSTEEEGRSSAISEKKLTLNQNIFRVSFRGTIQPILQRINS